MVDRTVAFGALLHGVKWHNERDEFPVGEGVVLQRASASPVSVLYEHLCRSQGLDDGDPLGFDVAVLIRPPAFCDPHLPDNPIDVLCDLIAIATGAPVLMMRGIWSDADFRESYGTDTLFQVYESALDRHPWSTLDETAVNEIVESWRNLQALDWKRVRNAMGFFHHGWRTVRGEQAVLSFAVCLEALFSPHSAGETTHQLAYNIAHFLGGSAVEKADCYQQVRDFYGVRSGLVHGGQLPDEKVRKAVSVGFSLARSVLRPILGDAATGPVFDDESARRLMLKRFMFGVLPDAEPDA